MQSPNPPPHEWGREYWSWFGFWAQFAVLGGLAILGASFAGQGGGPGDYTTGLTLCLAAIALAFLRLKRHFDGGATQWQRFLLVDNLRSLVLVIAVFVVLGLAGLFLAAAEEQGSLYVAGVALFATSGVIVFLSLKNVFDNLDRRG